MPIPPIDNPYAEYQGNQIVTDFLWGGKIPEGENGRQQLIGWLLEHEQYNALTWMSMKSEITSCFNLNGEKVQNLAYWLKDSPPVERLVLIWQEIGDEGAIAIASALKVNSALKILDLTGNNIGKEGAKALSSALDKNETLTSLNLSSNKIGATGTSELVPGLKKSTTLLALDLSKNRVGDDGAAEVESLLKENHTLRTLELRENKITEVGATSLAFGLKGNNALAKLDLGENQIGDDGATALASVFKVNQKLAELILWYNDIGEDGVTALASGLKGNRTVTMLDLDFNELDLNDLSDETEKALQEIAAILQHNVVRMCKPEARLYLNLCLRQAAKVDEFEYCSDISKRIVTQLTYHDPDLVAELWEKMYAIFPPADNGQ
ncbi:MAG: hypothetical protein JWQ23_2620 [Herminiimonas sp.]|nr:hypothetical protein [Herminiimonas sp.]